MTPEIVVAGVDKDYLDWLQEKGMLKRTQSNKSNPHAISNTAKEESPHHQPVFEYRGQINLDSHIAEYLQKSNDLEFDILKLESITNGHALYHLAGHQFHRFHLHSTLKIDPAKFERWMIKVEKTHIPNSYHNSAHTADVLYTMAYIISRYKIRPHITYEEIFACLIACIIHDNLHPGFNNSFMIETSHRLARLYNDVAVNEAHNSATFFEMMLDPQLDIFANLTPEQKKYIRELIICMVIGTDMVSHFEFIGKFKTKMSTNGIVFDQKNDKKLCLIMAIKCADQNYCAKPINLSRNWTKLITNEFFGQGDKEKALGLHISTFMDRNEMNVPKCQLVMVTLIIGLYWVCRPATL
jgi:hypothetical protein